MAAVPSIIEVSYDIPAIMSEVDFINYMAYDFRRWTDMELGHHSNLHAKAEESDADKQKSVVS